MPVGAWRVSGLAPERPAANQPSSQIVSDTAVVLCRRATACVGSHRCAIVFPSNLPDVGN